MEFNDLVRVSMLISSFDDSLQEVGWLLAIKGKCDINALVKNAIILSYGWDFSHMTKEWTRDFGKNISLKYTIEQVKSDWGNSDIIRVFINEDNVYNCVPLSLGLCPNTGKLQMIINKIAEKIKVKLCET